MWVRRLIVALGAACLALVAVSLGNALRLTADPPPCALAPSESERAAWAREREQLLAARRDWARDRARLCAQVLTGGAADAPVLAICNASGVRVRPPEAARAPPPTPRVSAPMAQTVDGVPAPSAAEAPVRQTVLRAEPGLPSPSARPPVPARRQRPAPPPSGWNQMPRFPPEQVRRQRSLAPEAPAPPAPLNPRIGILTVYEGRSSKFLSMCTYTKECYAKLHGHEFIMDDAPYRQAHGRHPAWNRIESLRKYLPRYDWVLYLDADIAITNLDIRLLDFVGQFQADSFFVWTEAKEGVNTGAFFIRNVPWAYWWMDKWWAFSKDIPDFAWNDQLALWDALVQHYATNGSTLPASQFSDRPCWSTPLINEGWRHAMRCHAMEMDFMGYPVKHRTAFHHEFWPQTRTPRGFTFFFSEPKTLWLWPREELYMPGDFVIHSHSNEVVTNLTKYHALRGTQCRGRLPKAG